MVSGTLYTYPNSYRAQKIQIAAAYSGADVKVQHNYQLNFQFGVNIDQSEEFLAKFPQGKVPAFEDSNGVCLSESNAIAYYVSSEALRGTNAVDQALVMEYLEFAENEILPSACTWVSIFFCLKLPGTGTHILLGIPIPSRFYKKTTHFDFQLRN